MRAVRRIAFLRAINVAGHATVKKEQLKAAFGTAGCESVRTYIQSGNVLFEAPRQGGAALLRRIEREVRGLLGSQAVVIVRTAGNLRRLVETVSPGAPARTGQVKRYVSFLESKPAAVPRLPLGSPRGDIEIVASSGPDVISLARKVGGRYGFPNDFVEKRFGVRATTRNWSTVTRIVELLSRTGPQ